MTTRLRSWVDDVTAWWAGYWLAAVKHAGLSAGDGNLSHTKTFGYAVLIVYVVAPHLPASVAITLIISAHGTKALLAWINKGSISVSALSDDSISVTKTTTKTETTTHNIDERVGWNAEREFQET